MTFADREKFPYPGMFFCSPTEEDNMTLTPRFDDVAECASGTAAYNGLDGEVPRGPCYLLASRSD